jgi:putative Holliday junction resolvase
VESSAQPRYLGLDIGRRRIGVAVSDELGLTAQPVLTLERRSSRRPISRDDLRSLARLCRRFGVVGIVVGNPVHLSGESSPQAAKAQAFAAELGELTGLPIHLWDERLTSHEAHQILYQAGHARQKHRKVVDQVAATLILQSFLESREQGSKGARNLKAGSESARGSRFSHPFRVSVNRVRNAPFCSLLATPYSLSSCSLAPLLTCSLIMKFQNV